MKEELMDMRVTRSGGACGSKGSDFWGVLRDERAQGTTEYAILVGVLVVIAFIAIVAVRDRGGELWDSISSEINSL